MMAPDRRDRSVGAWRCHRADDRPEARGNYRAVGGPADDVEAWRERRQMIGAVLGRGGVALGPFESKRLMGSAAAPFRLTDDIAQLPASGVGARDRRCGMAPALTKAIIRSVIENCTT